jgi:hypothetical protein
MAKKNFLQVLEGLFVKVDTTEARYEEALQKKEEALFLLQAELQERNAILTDMHKEALLGNISEATYEAEKQKVHQLQEAYNEASKEVRLIQEYKTEDVKSIMEEIDAVSKKHYADKQEELNKIRLELMNSKLVYLQAMVSANEKYNAIVSPNRKLDALQMQFGLKQRSYISGSFEALNQYSIPKGGYELLTVQQKEVYDALEYKRVSEQLKKIVQAGKVE